MAGDTGSLNRTISVYAALVRDMAILAAMLSLILSFIASLIWATYGERIVSRTGLATLEVVEGNRLAIEKLAADIAALRSSGKPDIMIEMEGFTYVVEPVYIDDRKVTLRSIVSRNPDYVGCITRSIVAIFVGEDRVREPSPQPIPVTSQLDVVPTPIEIDIFLPEDHGAGRYVMWLNVEYQCGSETYFDRTDNVIFNILPQRRPLKAP